MMDVHVRRQVLEFLWTALHGCLPRFGEVEGGVGHAFHATRHRNVHQSEHDGLSCHGSSWTARSNLDVRGLRGMTTHYELAQYSFSLVHTHTVRETRADKTASLSPTAGM